MVWWLILCVSLSGLKDAQRAGKTLFLNFLRVFLEEIIIWIGRLRKEDCLYPCRWASSNPVRAWIEQKHWKKDEFDLSAWQGYQSSLAFRHQCFWFLDLQNWTGTYTVSSPGSQTSLLRLNSTTGFPGSPSCRWQMVGLHEPITWVKSYNKSSLKYIFLYFIGSVLWRALT